MPAVSVRAAGTATAVIHDPESVPDEVAVDPKTAGPHDGTGFTLPVGGFAPDRDRGAGTQGGTVACVNVEITD
ncbi:hypothetical protein HNR23_003614 [Nocardiopsis mwathae]|uniref:Uncharacterized protein n=1 Tax=Nocardiopsis mwathae TaxID=1472723 RepID=A0A7X0D808_9ACTN|nr:hypothetical protein [Nocardiopsis mwathae]MBB6173554.1 hypothetical protein [Nocardiopsis mwathae]